MAHRRAKRAFWLTLVTVVFDLLCLYVAVAVADLMLDQPPFGPPAALRLAVAMAPVWIVVFAASGLHSPGRRLGRLSEIFRTMAAVILCMTSLIVVDYFSHQAILFSDRRTPLLAAAIGTVTILACRMAIRRVLRLLHLRGRALTNVVVVGSGPVADRLAMELQPAQGIQVVAAVSPTEAGGTFARAPIYATLEQALDSHRVEIDEVIQADAAMSREESARLMSVANDRGIAYRFVPDLYGVFTANSLMGTVAGVPVMEVRLTSLDGWAALGKRLVDIVGSIVGLILLSPVFALVATLIKVTDPAGPVLYRQQRLGKGGRTIGVYKFRSMLWEYSTGPDRPYKTAEEAFVAMGRADLVQEFAVNQKVEHDPRVSRLGSFLRRTSLDELPQLLNSLLGHLSLVGPRPITPAELERYGSGRHSFLALKPGITGLWQVSGRSSVGYDQRVKLDVYYAEHWSAGLDLTILAKTFSTVVARRGAY